MLLTPIFFLRFLRVKYVDALPWWVDQNSLRAFDMLIQVLTLDILIFFTLALDDFCKLFFLQLIVDVILFLDLRFPIHYQVKDADTIGHLPFLVFESHLLFKFRNSIDEIHRICTF